MEYPVLYRKRLIPNECVKLKDDTIISMDEERIVTTWKTLKPRKDFDHGTSVYFLKEGFKVSKFCKEDGSLHYWYCDIVDHEVNEKTNEITFIDLLADVIIYPNGKVKVVDIGELADAVDQKLITTEQLKSSLRKLDKLLEIIYAGNFGELQKYIE